jgi:hypothetical protein
MDLNRKYFGLTVTQLGILGGLAGIAFLLFCMVGCLLLGKVREKAFPQISAAAPTIQPTPTIILTPTLTTTPAPTPVPYASLVPTGWAQYRTALYEIWMLPGYKATKTIDVLMTGLGGNPVLDLSLKGAYTSKSTNKIYLTISYEPVTGDSFDAFIASHLTNLGVNPNERTKTTINADPAIRLVFSGRKGNNTDVNELTYVVLDGTTVWYLQYTAEITDFYNLLADFETSAKTFRMVK